MKPQKHFQKKKYLDYFFHIIFFHFITIKRFSYEVLYFHVEQIKPVISALTLFILK